MQDPAAKFIHDLNREAYSLNKKLIGKSSSLREVPIQKDIYSKQEPATPVPAQAPQPPVIPTNTPQVVNQQPQSNIDTDTAKEFIDRLTSVEKKIDRFFNLIERRVVKNAKEINIRIKLNENTDTGQE